MKQGVRLGGRLQGGCVQATSSSQGKPNSCQMLWGTTYCWHLLSAKRYYRAQQSLLESSERLWLGQEQSPFYVLPLNCSYHH